MYEPLKINPETAEALLRQARAQGVSVEDYLRLLLGIRELASDAQEPPSEDFIAAMESLAEDIEPLPRDFSREDIYFPEA